MDEKIDFANLQGVILSGRYRLDKYLAEGNFGAVYRATQMAYGVPLREVAIKISKHPMSDAEAVKSFGEALLTAKVIDNTPDLSIRGHFVAVYDADRCTSGALDGHPYMVMELVQGGSVGKFLKAGPFTLKRCVDYFDQMLSAVTFMHGGMAYPIAHRDLKPDNFLVARREGSPDLIKVTDFGLAVEVDKLLGWVSSGGDLAYLAPESFSRDISSPQSDVYMLGLVFYEMLTGVNPFSQVGIHLKGDDEEKRTEMRRLHLAARQMEKFVFLEQNVEIQQKPGLATVIRSALDADLNSRKYRTAGELKAAWDKAKQGVVDIGSATPWEEVQRLVEEAQQSMNVGDRGRGESLLQLAMNINRDKMKVPDRKISGRAYLLMVRQFIAAGNIREAGILANEGYKRRKCRTTCTSLAEYYGAIGSPLSAGFLKDSQTIGDQE